nr:hypothetical protein [Tanacetum cinerariifolium]
MSDSEDSTITYTAVSSPFGGLSDIGSPGVDGPPVMPEDPYAYVVDAFQAPPSPDYVSGPEYPPSPVFVPEPVYPEFMPAEDDILPVEEQPLPAAASPTTKSLGYIDEFDPAEDPEDDPEEYPEDDPEEDHEDDPDEDPADYPADGGDEGDDEDESSDDDEDDDIDIEKDKEEDEYLAPTDFTAVALPAVDHAPSAEETEPFETDESAATPPPHPAYRDTAKMSIRPQTPISLPSDTEIARLMAISTLPQSPFSPLSSPLPQIPSPLLPLLLPSPIDPTYEEAPLGYRAARLRWRTERERRFPRRTCRFERERGEGSMPAAMEVGYGITNAWDDLVGAIQEIAPTTMEGVNQRVSAQQTEITDLRAADPRFQTTVGTQQKKIRELWAADRKLQAQFTLALTALKSCQTQLTAALGRIQILEAARVPTQLEGVAKALAARDANRNTNGDDSHVLGTGAKRTERVTRECTYKIPIYYDDDDDEESYTPLRDIIILELPSCIAVTPVLSIKEPVDSLKMEDKHLDTIPTMESDEVKKSSVKDLVPIPSESEGNPDNMCDVPFRDNPPPLDISKDQFEDFSDSND